MKMLIAYVAVLWLAMWITTGLAADNSQIAIDSFKFTPQSLTVKAGATVTWINKDDVPHTIVSTTKKFRSPVLDVDKKFSYTFKDPGTYEYFCSVHPQMTGKVIVQ